MYFFIHIRGIFHQEIHRLTFRDCFSSVLHSYSVVKSQFPFFDRHSSQLKNLPTSFPPYMARVKMLSTSYHFFTFATFSIFSVSYFSRLLQISCVSSFKCQFSCPKMTLMHCKDYLSHPRIPANSSLTFPARGFSEGILHIIALSCSHP